MPLPLADLPCAVITVSDRCASGEREDESGLTLAEGLRAAGANVSVTVVADGAEVVRHAIRDAVNAGARVILTTGGTGIAERDETPEGTAKVIARQIPGIAELLRSGDPAAGPGAALSRGIAGVVHGQPDAIVVNVAGSRGAARFAGEVLPPALSHAIAQLDGEDH